MYCTIGGFTLDDTVLPTGEVRWAAPGGNALYSAIGAWLWGVEVGMVGLVGHDYPQSYLDHLVAAGFNLSGVRRVSGPSFHVWILHEGGGRRQIVYRLDSGNNTFLDPRVEDIPQEYLAGRGVHICPIRSDSQLALMDGLFRQQVPLFLDLIVIPGQIDIDPLHQPEAWRHLRALLPSIEEVRAIWGGIPLRVLIDRLRAVGPACSAIKLGNRGSVVSGPADGIVYHVPAYPSAVVDTTGAGDAYCGGFMVGLSETDDAVEGALRGTVSASVVVEDFGALHALQVSGRTIQERLEKLRSRVRPLSEADLMSPIWS